MKQIIKGSCTKYGPLVSLAGQFQKYLLELGYDSNSANNLLGVFHHLSRWMSIEGKDISDLNVAETDRFLKHRRELGYICWRSQKGLRPIINFLLSLKVLERFESNGVRYPLDELIEEYCEYLAEERQICPSTIGTYKKISHRFLKWSVGSNLEFGKLDSKAIREFLLKENHEFGRSRAKCIVTPLRSVLRWLHVEGKLDTPLYTSVPAVAGRRTSLPQGVNDEGVRVLLKSCDRRTHGGRRAYAALLLMVRMGLRKGEIANLTLDCINWHRAEMILKAKGSEEKLPLSQEVGEALMQYIGRSRPFGNHRHIFLRLRAPFTPLSGSGMTAILHSACKRAGMEPIGPHRLRHTVAAQMLKRGSALSEIAQVLRHNSIDTTSIYAKVDHLRLRDVVREWPGGVQ